MNLILGIFSGVWIIFLVLSTVWMLGAQEDRRALSPIKTGLWMALFALALGCLSGILAGNTTFAFVYGIARTDAWGQHWGFLLSGSAFITAWLFSARFLWNDASMLRSIEPGWSGVILILGRRLREYHLLEGNHRLLSFFRIVPVDMRTMRGETLSFDEVTKDGVKMLVELFRIWRIRNPDRYLDNKGAETLLNGIAETAAREFIRKKIKDELMAPSSPDELTRAIVEALVRYDTELEKDGRDFLHRKSIGVKIEKLEPPKEITDAAAKKLAATEENLRKEKELEGLLERFEEFRKANMGLSPSELVSLFQRYEKLVVANEIVIRGLEGSPDPTYRALAASILGAASERNNLKKD